MFGWLKSLFRITPAPEVTCVHPLLGRLRYEDGIWEGRAPHDPDLTISVAGDVAGPDPGRVQRLVATLGRLDDMRRQVDEFIGPQIPSRTGVKAADFVIREVSFLRSREADYFMVWLDLPGDAYGLWKVEFVGGRPKWFSRDD